MDTAAHLDHLTREVDLLAEAAERAGPDAPVPTCPDWTVRDLLAHTGEIYRWAARVLRGEQQDFPTSWPDVADAELVDRLRAGAGEAAGLLRAAPGDVQCWTFWPEADPAHFWARRMANETAVHRIDAQRAVGAVTPVETEQAIDGIDELLAGLLAVRPRGVRTEEPVRLAVVPEDAEAWVVTLTAERIAAVPGSGTAELTVTGTAAELFTWLWNRDGEVSLSGDLQVAQLWQRVRVRLV